MFNLYITKNIFLQTVEQPPYVDLREKNSDQIAATKDKKQELMPESSNTVQKTGMPFKRNAGEGIYFQPTIFIC